MSVQKSGASETYTLGKVSSIFINVEYPENPGTFSFHIIDNIERNMCLCLMASNFSSKNLVCVIRSMGIESPIGSGNGH